MKRILFLLCALLLLKDLADDGCLCKATALPPHGPGKFSFTTSPDSSGTIVGRFGFRLGNCEVSSSAGITNRLSLRLEIRWRRSTATF